MDLLTVPVLLAVALAGGLAAWLWARERYRAQTARAAGEITQLNARLEARSERVNQLEAEVGQIPQLVAARARLEAELHAERQGGAERQAMVERGVAALRTAAESASGEALERNSRTFLKLARATFQEFHRAAEGDLDARRAAMGRLVVPLEDAMHRLDRTLETVERDRVGSQASLGRQLEAITEAHHRLQAETAGLAQALNAPSVRGKWGEMQLRRVVELAGMVERCDFTEQVATATEDGQLRPDLIVHLPGDRRIVVDAKAPLSALLNGTNADVADLETHARQVRQHMTRLGAKRYWAQFEQTPEFVVMFLPGESVFARALECDPDLVEHGVRHRVLPASPTTLIALLRATAYGWQRDQLAANVEEIGIAGRELYDGLMALTNISLVWAVVWGKPWRSTIARSRPWIMGSFRRPSGYADWGLGRIWIRARWLPWRRRVPHLKRQMKRSSGIETERLHLHRGFLDSGSPHLLHRTRATSVRMPFHDDIHVTISHPRRHPRRIARDPRAYAPVDFIIERRRPCSAARCTNESDRVGSGPHRSFRETVANQQSRGAHSLRGNARHVQPYGASAGRTRFVAATIVG